MDGPIHDIVGVTSRKPLSSIRDLRHLLVSKDFIFMKKENILSKEWREFAEAVNGREREWKTDIFYDLIL